MEKGPGDEGRTPSLLQLHNQIIQRVRESFHRALERHFIQRVHDLRVLRVGLEPDDDEAGYGERLEEFFAFLLDGSGVHGLLRII